MDKKAVFAKTDKGLVEIEKRTYHLNFKHRTALILVNGEHTVEELLKNLSETGEAVLEQLLRDGFIASASGSVPAEVEKSASAPPTSGDGQFNLAAAKIQASRALEKVLGPGGDSLAIAIERTKTKEEFALRAQSARDIISQMVGPRKAAEFWAQTGL